jgi:hypothetical protein
MELITRSSYYSPKKPLTMLNNNQKRALWHQTKTKIKKFLKLQGEISENLDKIRGNKFQVEQHQRSLQEWEMVKTSIDQFLQLDQAQKEN